MKVEIVRDVKEEEGNLPIFCQEKFLKSRSDNYGWFFENGKILPFIIDKRLIFKRLIFTDTIYSIVPFSVEEEKDFLNQVVEQTRLQLKVDFIAKPQANVFFNALPSHAIGAEWGSFVVGINEEDDLILKKFKSRTRTKVRKAIKNNVKVQLDKLDDVYSIIKHTFERQGEGVLSPSKSYIESLVKNNKKNILILSAYHQTRLQGGIIVLFDKNKAYYYYGGSVQKPFDGSLFLLHFEAMKLLRNQGVQVYDFMGARTVVSKGSKVQGIQRFKQQFGTTLKKGYVFKTVFKPIKYRLFNLAVAIAYKFKGGKYEGDPIDQILKESRDVG